MDGSALDQFVSGLAATLVGGTVLLFVGYAAIEHRLATKARRRALRITHDELRSITRDLKRFTKMLSDNDVPYGRFGTNGWELLSRSGVLEGITHETSEALIAVYNNVRAMNGKLDKFAEMRVGMMAVVMEATTAAATKRFWGLRPAVRNLENRYYHEVAELKENMLARFPGFREQVELAIRAVEAERDYRDRP